MNVNDSTSVAARAAAIDAASPRRAVAAPTPTLGWLTLIGASQAEVVDAAAEAGFRSVSIRITGRRPGEAFEPIVGHPAALRELARRLGDGGLRLSNTSAFHLSPDVTLDMLRPAIEATVELGAPVMVATCTDSNHRRWCDFMARYCEVARDAGVTLALEFVPFSEARTLDVGLDLVRRIDAPNLGLLVDALHLARSGGTPADLAKVDSSRIVFAQLCDAVATRPPFEGLASEARTGRLPPGDGALPLAAFLDALPAGTELEIEMPQARNAGLPAAEQARRARGAVRDWLARWCESRGRPDWT